MTVRYRGLTLATNTGGASIRFRVTDDEYSPVEVETSVVSQGSRVFYLSVGATF
jgi:hypothetical protein